MTPFRSACAYGITAVTLAILVFNLTASTAGLRLASADDVALIRGLTEPEVASRNRMHEFQMGRFYADPKYHLQEAIAEVGSNTFHSGIRVAFFFAAALSAAWFSCALTGSRAAGLAVLLVAVGWLQISVTYQPLLSYPHLWVAWTALWAMGALALRPESAGARIGLMLAFGLALSVHEAAAPFIVWPFLVRWAAGRRGTWIEEWRRIAGCLMILAGYLACYLVLRRAGTALPETLYTGGQVSLAAGEALFALAVFSAGASPGLEAWVNRWGVSPDALLLPPGDWWQRIMTWTEPRDCVIAGLVGLAFCALAFLLPRPERPTQFWRVTLALAFAILAPVLLLCLTVKYQQWSHHRMWPYYYSSMTYLAMVVLIVVGLLRALSHLQSRATRAALGVFVLLGASLLTLGVQAVNRESLWLLRQHTFSHSDDFRDWIDAQPAVREIILRGKRGPAGRP